MTDFLYPFLEAGERDAVPLLADLAASAEAKAIESRRLRAEALDSCAAALDGAAAALAARLGAGGTVLVCGNGGSSTDAAGVAALFLRPPWGRPLRARSLVADSAVVTALANDVGFDLVFARQLMAGAGPGDALLAISTSGNSGNLVAAFVEARRRGLLVLGLAGYGGGQMASSPEVDHCLVVGSQSVHRIQEAQAALAFALWQRVQELVEGPDR